MTTQAIKLVLASPEFFSTPPKRLVVEESEGAGRTYILKADRIVAVGIPLNQEAGT